MKIYDISLRLDESLPCWPGDPPPVFERGGIQDVVLSLRLSAHAGTHVDAPAHAAPGGALADELDLGVLVGPAVVIALAGSGHVTAADLERSGIGPEVERLLIKTANSGRLNACDRRFHEDFIALAPDAARWIAARPIRLVGVDALSVDPFDSEEHPAHGLLLGKGVVVVEGLDLSGVGPGAYWLACLPLRVAGADGAPARAVLMEDEAHD